jgi:DnaD/phage-associated family protein
MRSRNIKPGFFSDEELLECPPLTRLLFAGLWCLSDRRGRTNDNPKRIKIELLPCDNCDIDEMLQELHDRRLIVRYEINGRRYIQVRNFEKHQSPHYKEAESTIPPQYQHDATLVEAQGQPKALPHSIEPKTRGLPDASRADSGFLIPDSLIPDSGFLIPDSVHEREQQGVIMYCQNAGIHLTARHFEEVAEFLAKGATHEVMCYAVDVTIENGAKGWAYARAIIQRWLAAGATTVDAARVEQANFKRKKEEPSLGRMDFDF